MTNTSFISYRDFLQ